MTEQELKRALQSLESHLQRIEQSQTYELRQIKRLVEQVLSRLR